MSAERSVSVIGLGRVGLPLALSFADRGCGSSGSITTRRSSNRVRAGRMPFSEEGTQELLDRVLRSGRLELSDSAAGAARADDIVITIGTPSFSHIESDLRQVRAAIDDLLPQLRPGHALILRSTIAPGTTEFVAGYIEKRRGLRAGEDVFVAHAPERIAAGRFLAEITTLPCIVGGVGDASTERAAALFGVFGAPIVRTTPVQAELAKIWTNILRYATFALPNLLMMDCERYGANVFDVIELINRDYPRGGIAMPGLTAGTCLRKDFAFSEERSNAPGMLLAVSRVNEAVPLFLVEGIKRRISSLANRKVAVLGSDVQARHRRRARLAVAEADPAARARTGGRRGLRSARAVADAVAGRRARGRRGRDRRDQPLGVRRTGRARGDPRASARRLPRRRSVERARVRPGVRVRVGVGGAGRAAPHVRPAGIEPGPGHGRRRHDRSAVVRRLLRDADWEVRVSDHREAPQWMREGCEVHTGDLREGEVARAAIAGCTHVIHLAAIVGGIANFHKLPFTLTAGQQRADRRGRRSRRDRGGRATRLRVLVDGVRARDGVPDDRGARARCPSPWSAYGFSKLSGEVYARAAHDQHGLRYTICRPFNAYGPGELPDRDEPGIAHAVPDLIAKTLAGQRPLQIFGSGEQTRTLTHVDDIADGIVTAMASAAGGNEDFNISASQELTVAQIAALIWEVCGKDPADFELEHLPSFEVDVQRRWPSVEKARRVLGWEARVELREGLRQTADWLGNVERTAKIT